MVPRLRAEERAAAAGSVVVAHVDDSVTSARPGSAGAGGEPSPGPVEESVVPPETARLTADAFGPGAVAEALAKVAVARRAGAIVVGSRGRSKVREVLLGSVARAVLQDGHRPVLVVPPPRG